MKPLDPRLVRAARAVRVHLVVAVGCGVGLTGLILVQAWLLARGITGATDGEGLADLAPILGLLLVVMLARAGVAYGAEAAALRSAAHTKSTLRRRLLTHVHRSAQEHGRVGDGRRGAGELATLASRGLDALDEYFARYLPQLVLAVLVPVAVLVVVAQADWISAVVIGVTLPLIPVFMILIGWHTQAQTKRQWHLLNRLGGHFLDVVQGLPTLAIFRRAQAQAAAIRRVSEQHRSATMRTLRVAFLSAFALELLATLAVALVAVEVGLRLMYGMLDYQTALLVLLLAPEAYLPLREVGARFHASMEGVAAAEQVFDTVEDSERRAEEDADASTPVPPLGRMSRRSSDPVEREIPVISLDDVGLTYPGRSTPALRSVSLELPPLSRTLLTGPSGSGKSSLFALLMRFATPTEGGITLRNATGTRSLHDISPEEWRHDLAWVPQHPYLFDDTVADNIRLGDPDADLDRVRAAAELAEADSFINELPHGYETRLGERGSRLSAGQRQRIALARAFLRDAPVVLLDEPTAHLDPPNALIVRRATARLLNGRTGVIVAHDEGWLSSGAANDVVRLEQGRLTVGVTS
ncbi:thiol reductant ABC exporter subunit CydD [Spiractinospora alimapuensis]|uniref:thiol reductant ABC exporter subunit CydD n=1 Tax=Spiractinospora alimapuensis TaxID=2820884 RepID=UPI001EEA21CC|nr:thiol reductant ABC exporter subunit CydD [Spiractinospora alimapuensis]QVQ51651.1 thiol reductant ABC exporter subunit CydD [Spiractinospora alimapuensis]